MLESLTHNNSVIIQWYVNYTCIAIITSIEHSGGSDFLHNEMQF
jgi:hypothetical protein